MSSKKLLLALGIGVCTYSISSAQITIDFDSISIPEGYISYADALPIPAVDSNYFFSSNDVKFNGIKASWGGFVGLDCSRNTDTTTGTYLNDRSAIAGAGYASSPQYAIGYLNTMYPEAPTDTYPLGLKISNDDQPYLVQGAYFTNTTWAYKYMLSTGTPGYIQLHLKGYYAGAATDSITIDLINITSTDTVMLKDWTYFDLSALGAIDSMTFRLTSNDPFSPYYFAMDNLIIKPAATSIPDIATSLEATIYPNPSSNVIYIQHATPGNIAYHIYDMQGKIIESGTYEDAIHIAHLANGQYILQLISLSSAQRGTYPFVKK